MGEQGVAELVSALVAIDSVNPDPCRAERGEERSRPTWRRGCGTPGWTWRSTRPPRAAPASWASRAGAAAGRSLMLNGHLDTVGVEGMERPFEPVVRDGRLYARGGYDMKAGVAACMIAAKRLPG